MATEFMKSHFDTEGLLGIPMKDAQAKMLEGVVSSLPAEDRAITRLLTAKAPSDLIQTNLYFP